MTTPEPPSSGSASEVDEVRAKRTRKWQEPHPAQRIVDATRALVARSGIESLTHRAIAQEAGVSLGSTTYYFRNLDAIIEAALEQSIDEDTEKLENWAGLIGGPDDLVEALTTRIMEDSADRERELLWYQLYLWGARTPAGQELCYRWSRVMTTILERFVDAETAEVLSTVYDSLLMRVMVSGGRIHAKDVRRVLNAVVDAQASRA